MGRKKTQEQFKKEVYELVGDEFEVVSDYLGANINIQLLHKKCNRVIEITPSNFLSHNHRCKYCHYDSLRLTYEYVNEYIQKIGYTLLSDHYINTEEKLLIKCDNDHTFNMNFSNIKIGQRCPKCANIKTGDRCRLDGNYIINKFIINGFIPLFNESDYINSQQKLPCICINHKDKGTQFITYNHIQGGGGCKYCAIDNLADLKRKDVNLVIQDFKDRTLIPMFSQDDYKNNHTPLPYICLLHEEKGVQYIKYGNLLKGKGCRYCGIEEISGKNSYLWQGGITNENRSLRNSKEYKHWREEVFKRDDYTCQVCGKRGCKLQAHHLENFADNPKLRFNISNGTTMCFECHDISVENSFHKLYSMYNNTKEQFEEYVQRYKNGKLTMSYLLNT